MARGTISPAELTRIVCERPLPLRIGGRSYYIHPPSLGKSLLVSALLARLGVDAAAASRGPAGLLAAVEADEEAALRLCAMILSRSRAELLDEAHLEALRADLRANTDAAGRVEILHAYLTHRPAAHWMRALGIDRERRRLDKIMRAKDRSSSVAVGAVTVFGSLIDAACQRYGWTYEYTVWGVSLVSLQLMLADAQQVVFLTDKERRRAGVSTDGVRLDADDPANEGRIVELLSK